MAREDSLYYIGVDVGTSSVRAALVSRSGVVLKTSVQDLSVYTDNTDHYEQSSSEIWSYCCLVIKAVIDGVKVQEIGGIGFDATCSLVVLDQRFNPVSCNADGDDKRNVIMWLDHRAAEQAKFITSTKHDVLKFVGQEMSLEMQPPKLLWLKQNLPDKCWSRAHHFFDLPDFLTWKMTGVLTRSMCSVTCKWMYSARDGWNEDFWSEIGLSDLNSDNFKKIGSEVQHVGESVGEGVSTAASIETNLAVGTPVGVSLIDAYCGAIGTLGCSLENLELHFNIPLASRVALISGTSSCHLSLSTKPFFLPGVWGPYLSVMMPGYWLNEGGQSAVASLLENIVQSHSAFLELQQLSASSNLHPHVYLNDVLKKAASDRGVKAIDLLNNDIHVLPDFHGNRSPLADPSMKGMISGLTLDKTINGLAMTYLAAIQGLALGTKHILDTMTKGGHNLKVIFLTGGLRKNPLFVQVNSNATGLPVALTKESESVLVGAAILGACASSNCTLEKAMKNMTSVGKIIKPEEATRDYYEKKYSVFLRMGDHQKEYFKLMNQQAM